MRWKDNPENRRKENVCKRSNWQGINLQNIQTAQQQQQQQQQQTPIGGRPKWIFFQTRYIDDWQTDEKDAEHH